MLTMKKLRTTDADFETAFQKMLAGKESLAANVESAVRPILREVKKWGDAALFAYTRRFDRITLTKQSVVLTREEIEHAYASIPQGDREALSLAADRIESFHRLQYQRLTGGMANGEGVGEVIRPLQRVGLYVPGGKASYPSSVLMTAIPARVAGVKEIIMVTPGQSLPVLAAAHIGGVHQIYRVGGGAGYSGTCVRN